MRHLTQEQFNEEQFVRFRNEYINDPHVVDIKNEKNQYVMIIDKKYKDSKMLSYPKVCGYMPVIVQYGINGEREEWKGSYH